MTPLIALQDVKSWLQGDPSKDFPAANNAILERIIGAVSNYVLQYISGPVAPLTFTELYNGRDRPTLTLRQQPVISVQSLTVGSTSFTARTGLTGSGYVFDDTSVTLVDGCFWRGAQNVQVIYEAGYQTSDAVTVATSPDAPPAGSVSAQDLSRAWNSDRGVAYANGTALTLVTTAPSVAGTYQVTQDSKGYGLYVFAAADVGASITITYGFTPEDMGQALIELAGERFRARNRIGESSQSVGGHVTTSFSQRDMNATIRSLLAPFRNVVPVP